jgi:hypothetical protein
MTGAVMTAARPKVLFVYFTCSQQTLRLIEATTDGPRVGSSELKPQIEDDMRALQTVTAVIEAGAGLALLALPSLTASLLLGTSLESPAAVTLARVGGAAIIALAIFCWSARGNLYRSVLQGVVVALLFYNLAVAGVLAFAYLGLDLHGILLWLAVAFHIAMAAWCVATLLRSEEGVLR